MDRPIAKKKLRDNPALIITLGFLSVILIGTGLLLIPFSAKRPLNIMEAVFTAFSSVCAAGLTVIDVMTDLTIFGQVVVLLLIQVGGLGVMSITSLIFILIGKKITIKDRLIMQESFNVSEMQGVLKLALRIVYTTLIIEGIGAVLLLGVFIPISSTVGMGIFRSAFMAVSAFCNNGISIVDQTILSGFTVNVLFNLSIIMLVVLGGLGFNVINEILKNKKMSDYSMQTKIVLKGTAVLLLLGTVVFMCFEYNNPNTTGHLNFLSTFLEGVFFSVSARSSGMSTLPVENMHSPTQFVGIILMLIGAGPGSTGGGIKITTFVLIIAAAIAGIRGRSEVILHKRTIPTKTVLKAVSVFFFAVTVIVLSTIVIIMAEQFESSKFLQTFFVTTSSFCTTGLDAGILSDLGNISKTVLIVDMFIGRIGLVTFGLLFLGGQNKTSIGYPEGKITVA